VPEAFGDATDFFGGFISLDDFFLKSFVGVVEASDLVR
jgi:hypothetical protein